MIKVSWQEHFKSSIEGAEEAFQQVLSEGASLSRIRPEPAFLSYCLSQNLIHGRSYLEWAKEAHQLPVLMDEFFVTRSAPVDLYRAHQDLFSWNPACLPVAEWDGVLMVACLEVPADFPKSQPVAFLLASPALMAQTWELVLQALEQQPAARYEAPSQPQSTDLAASAMEELLGAASSAPKELFNSNGELLLKDDEEPEIESSNPDIEVHEEAGGSPEGLFAETVVDATLLTNFSMNFEAKPADFAAKPTPVENTQAPLAPLPAASGLVKGPRTVEPLASLPAMEDSISIEEIETPETPEVLAEVHASMPAPAAPAAVAAPAAPMKSSSPQSSTAAYLLEKLRKQNPQGFEIEVQNTFKKLKPYFKKSMFLAVGDKDRVIKPLVWDENFQAPQAGQPEFDLRTPSFFRIVATTQKPYHGFVVTNDFNESFFEAWNQGQVPDHITMVPFMDGDLVIGMLLCLGEKSSYNRHVLQFAETASKELSANLTKQTGVSSTKAVA